jgi:hypothetical protein
MAALEGVEADDRTDQHRQGVEPSDEHSERMRGRANPGPVRSIVQR